ncbi:Na+/H+ antiporter NhaC family protein [Vibrio bivalvicida]|uniref:Sodium:proton antiporter n=1 Tax=Vibrio bivalvicida TaxID=1276888 RepID=A0A177XXA3_9VIBR|nr:Na+/H+ antiporter NhaC family protein [Vibrio bivalvicida]OAJ93232.1 sodium:proton antiporter [Vibrio bivalvicida]
MTNWLPLLPPLVAVTLAIATRQVFLAIATGLLTASIILQHNLFSGVTASFDAIAMVFSSRYAVKSLLFIAMIGALSNVMNQSGGLNNLLQFLSEKRGIVRSPASAQLFTFFMGLLMCLEGIGSMMMVGMVGKPLFARHGLSKTRLAYFANSTGSPIAWLNPASGAGVMLAGLIAAQSGGHLQAVKPISTLVAAVPYQFYSLLVLLSVPVLALTKQKTQDNTQLKHQDRQPQSPESINHWKLIGGALPITLLLASVIAICWTTGSGSVMKGDVSDAVYWGGYIALIGSGIYYSLIGIKVAQYIEWCIDGIKGMVPALVILILAMALSQVIGKLGTGALLSKLLSDTLPLWLIPAVVFSVGIFISFSTGSSGATVSILAPLAIGLALHLHLPVAIVLGAVLSGAVFGDQNSPISDSVIVAASAAGCEPQQHFMTQLPITCSLAGFAMGGYLLLGVTL